MIGDYYTNDGQIFVGIGGFSDSPFGITLGVGGFRECAPEYAMKPVEAVKENEETSDEDI